MGAFHVCSLYQLNSDDATAELTNLAKANSLCRTGEKFGFNEWIHAKTAEALGQYGQSWSAGMFIGAMMASRGKQPLGFLKASG